LVKANGLFGEANACLEEWINALDQPRALTGRAEVLFAAESQLARKVLIGEWHDPKEVLQTKPGIQLVCISELDPNAQFFRELGGIGALLYSGVTEDHVVEMMKN